MKPELRPYQKEGVEFLLKNKRVILADEMGLGKTAQALSAIATLQTYPLFIICPVILCEMWRRACIEWLEIDESEVVILRPKKNFHKCKVYIIGYSIVSRFKDSIVATSPRAVILDESQKVKNAATARSKACKYICQNVPIVFALTGTPVENRPSEFASQLEIIKQIDQFGSSWSFLNRFCNPNGFGKRDKFGRFDFTGANNIVELNSRLKQSCYIRRLKADVLPELPAKTRTKIPLEIDNPKAYSSAEDDVISWLTAEQGEEAAARANKAEELVKLEVLKRLAVHGKMSSVIEWLDDFLESGEKIAVFTSHKDIAAFLADRFKCGALTGDTSFDKRITLCDDFQNNPDTKMLVLNLQAGGLGLNLQAAANVAVIELPWNPAVLDQAEDRVHRIGQGRPVNIWYLIAEETVEESIYDLIKYKRMVVSLATEGGSEMDEQNLQAATADRLRRRRLERRLARDAKIDGKRLSGSG